MPVVFRPAVSKYHAEPVVIEGHRFPSKREATRYLDLELALRLGTIRGLELQPPYELCAWTIEGPVTIGRYKADFRYWREVPGPTGPIWVQVVEDAKGIRTSLYRWKKRHVEAQYGIRIVEV